MILAKIQESPQRATLASPTRKEDFRYFVGSKSLLGNSEQFGCIATQDRQLIRVTQSGYAQD
jgi:hypothetical protein